MEALRPIYRNVVAETLLLAAVFVQVISGVRLARQRWAAALGFWDKLQLWSGLYLAMFFVFHLGAVFAGRLALGLDTNFYFGAAGLNQFPLVLFFVPYYGLAIMSFFAHLAAVHSKKMRSAVLGISPQTQSAGILLLGVVLAVVVLAGFTGGFRGVEIPKGYHLLGGG